MSEDGKQFDANAFEKKQEAEKLAEQREALLTAVAFAVVQEGQEPTPITRLDVLSSNWRQMAARLLKVIDPESYAKYRAMKYGSDGQNRNPEFAARKRAYQFAIRRFLETSYKIAGC